MTHRTNRTGTPGKTPSKGGRGAKARAQTRAWTRRFLAALSECGNISAASCAAGVSSVAAYNRRAADATFAKAWDDALHESVDLLKTEARRRAVDGVGVPYSHQGELSFVAIDANGHAVPEAQALGKSGEPLPGYQLVPFVKRVYSDAMLIMLLKCGRPSEFGPHPLQKRRGVDEAAGEDVSLSLGMKQAILPARARW